MKFYRGRLIDHLHLHSADVEASREFYRAALAALDPDIEILEGPDYFAFDELWIDADTSHGKPAPVHFAFQAADQDAVDRFYAAAMKAGGRDNGAPGIRHYHPGYYAAFVFDPDGNNVEAVFHGPAKRSAASVEIEA